MLGNKPCFTFLVDPSFDLDEETMDAFMDRCDLNGDGEISFDEFAKVMGTAEGWSWPTFHIPYIFQTGWSKFVVKLVAAYENFCHHGKKRTWFWLEKKLSSNIIIITGATNDT